MVGPIGWIQLDFLLGGPAADLVQRSQWQIFGVFCLETCFSSSLQPCMHTFCAACYSGWMERSSLCPTCRCPVERICKNHILNNLVEAYLIQHPGKCLNLPDLSLFRGWDCELCSEQSRCLSVFVMLNVPVSFASRQESQ
jgi:hypothetical protein